MYTLIELCGSVVGLTRLINEIYNLGDGTLALLMKESSIIRVALHHVQGMTNSPHLVRFETDTDLYDGFNTVLDACAVTLQAVFEEMKRICGSGLDNRWKSIPNPTLPTIAKLRLIFSKPRLKVLLGKLRDESGALHLLLQVFYTGSMTEVSKILRTIQPGLTRIREDTSDICTPYSSSEDLSEPISSGEDDE